MRLIDANALADALFEKRKNYPQWVADTIGKMPDAVVRCKDCKHGYECEFDIKCENEDNPQMFGTRHKPDWFCADGKRRSDDG